MPVFRRQASHPALDPEKLENGSSTASMTTRSVDSPNTFFASLRHFLKHWIGVDRAILYTVLARFWGAASGLVTVLLVARFLSPSEQGYYYTFSSLVALQIVFELGFSFVILQLAAHERAALILHEDGNIEGDAVAHSRLASILQRAVRWYAVAGILMTVTILAAGFYFFSVNRTASHISWQFPWVLLVLASMCTFQIDPIFSFLEGCGYIADVARRRVLQAALGSLMAWAVLILHHGLFAPAMIIWGQVIVGLSMLTFSKFRPLLKGLWHRDHGSHAISWRREIFPFQWRIAISWLCGYFIFQIFNPILFAYCGSVAAGKFGMSMTIATSIGGVALSWIYTKSSPFGAMVSRREFAALNKLFFRTVWQSSLILLFGCCAFLLVLFAARGVYPRFVARLVSPGYFGLLLICIVVNHVTNCQAIYLRAFKREPFLWPTVLSALMVTTQTFFLAKYAGANAVIVGLFLQGVLVGLPVATYVFITRRREWNHQALPEQGAA